MGRWVGSGLLLYPLVVWGMAARLGLPLADAAFLAGLIALLPVLAVAQLPLTTQARLERGPAYVASAITVAVLGLAAAALGFRRLGLEGMGLGPLPWPSWAAWAGATTAAGALVVLAVHGLRRLTGVQESPLLLELLPRTSREKRLFAVLSLAAGLGEEVAFRGYALPVLAPHLGGAWGAALFTSVVFGLLHAYQGPLGMARTALLGLILAASLILSGSLWPAIAAHVALDLLAGFVWGRRLAS